MHSFSMHHESRTTVGNIHQKSNISFSEGAPPGAVFRVVNEAYAPHSRRWEMLRYIHTLLKL